MTLPVTTHDIKDWVRRAAKIVNTLSETNNSGQCIFTAQSEPTSPVAGQTYFDSTTDKLRTYDGTVWQDHW